MRVSFTEIFAGGGSKGKARPVGGVLAGLDIRQLPGKVDDLKHLRIVPTEQSTFASHGSGYITVELGGMAVEFWWEDFENVVQAAINARHEAQSQAGSLKSPVSRGKSQ